MPPALPRMNGVVTKNLADALTRLLDAGESRGLNVFQIQGPQAPMERRGPFGPQEILPLVALSPVLTQEVSKRFQTPV